MTQKQHVMHGRDHALGGADPIPGLNGGGGGGVEWADTGGGAAAVNWTKIYDGTLPTVGTFDVAGIPAGYADLMLIVIARGTNNAGGEQLRMRLNNDSVAHYAVQRINASGTAVGASEELTVTSWWVAQIVGAAGTANVFSYASIYLPGYSSTVWHKLCFSNNDNANTLVAGGKPMNIFSGIWNQTTAVDRVTLYGNSIANLAVGSRLRIYGIA